MYKFSKVAECIDTNKFKGFQKPYPPIDAVYTWINGADEVYQHSRSLYLNQESRSAICKDSAVESRVRDRNELKFSLRSLTQFAPWINHIYIITSFKQRPDWLKDHPRITLVPDISLFPEKKNLPTFNSQAIECHLDQIDGLSEYFISINDDMFIGRPLDPMDFLLPSGVMLGGLEIPLRETPKGVFQESDGSYVAAWKNNSSALDCVFGVKKRFFPLHQARILSKSVLQECRRLFASSYAATSESRFRASNNIAPVGLAFYTALNQGKMILSNHLTAAFAPLTDDNQLNKYYFYYILSIKPHLFCINDDITEAADPMTDLSFYQFMYTYFPEKSPFEI
ncbi:MAG TPA: Stealth CR1 domain-containing protein [Desulfobacteraceae bacterium]|nr:Stealth CR1 domain-containing protein [Desulfobacteraceae bacterium]HPJ68073.1 Stealth CR1 domain-containing protein [Desulfobacteraceae bacterium]HPQ28628.1 Stealth CR1 domain-containing protein [Desulfobacteraceae bacterium]